MYSLLYFMLTCSTVTLMLSESVRLGDAGPSSQAVLAKQNVSMSCMDDGYSGKGVQWQFIKVGTDEYKKIYSNHSILKNYTNRFRVQKSNVSYMLIIENITRDDAGAYYCLTKTGEHIAQLIVLESDPVCQINATEMRNESLNGQIRLNENSIIEASCTIRMWGNWFPNMHWKTREGLILLNQTDLNQTELIENKPITSIAHIAINLTTWNGTSQITCITNFTEEFKPAWKGGSISIPDYIHTWDSPSIFIDWDKEQITTGASSTVTMSVIPSAIPWKEEPLKSERDSRHDALVVIISILGSILLLVLIVSVALGAGYRHKNRKIQLLYNRTNTISKSKKSEMCREGTNTADRSSGYETYDLIDENAMIPTIKPTKTSVYRQATNSYEEIPLHSEDSLKSNYQDVESSAANGDAHQNNKYTPLQESDINDDGEEHPTAAEDPVLSEYLNFADPLSDSTDRVYEESRDVSSGKADGEYTKLDDQKAADQKSSGKYTKVGRSMNKSLNEKDFKPASYIEIIADEMSNDYDYDNAISRSNYTKLDGRNVADQTSGDYTKCEGSMNDSSIKTNLKPSLYLEIVADIQK